MARLLVSVRSARETRLALAGGASIIDVKEPANGPLGRAPLETWDEIRSVPPADVAMSVALGELREWVDQAPPFPPSQAFSRFAFAKVGLAGAGPDWIGDWKRLRSRLGDDRLRWIAVVYTDWKTARAPSPSEVLAADLDVFGVLFDTWDKAKPAEWSVEIEQAVEGFRRRGLAIALAGGLRADRLDRLAALRPDIVAVRGAACVAGLRDGTIDPRRVAELVEMVGRLPRSPGFQDLGGRAWSSTSSGSSSSR